MRSNLFLHGKLDWDVVDCTPHKWSSSQWSNFGVEASNQIQGPRFVENQSRMSTMIDDFCGELSKRPAHDGNFGIRMVESIHLSYEDSETLRWLEKQAESD